MSKITLVSGAQHSVSDTDAAKITQAMLGVGALAVNVTLDGHRRVFISGAAVLIVEPLADEGDTAA
jgi:hypothetical protein